MSSDCPLPFLSTGLPVEAYLDQLSQHLEQQGAAVLQAEPGAGKTTLVPPGLFLHPWLGGQKILMLQPRRIAARAAAERIASLLGEPVGQRVGYRIALESRISAATRIEILTEGILGRMIQDQPDLPGVGLIIFDEFHERSLPADLGLALALESRDNLRPDLRLLVMSATIDTAALSRLIGGDSQPAPIISCPGRSFAVAVDWCGPRPGNDGRTCDFWNDKRTFLELIATRILDGLNAIQDDILVFLPGQGEIRRVAENLVGRLPSNVELVCLHGSMDSASQNAALQSASCRRVILATNVAETSLTIPGVELVIDSGLVRVNRFDSRLGMDRLVTERLSLASSRQRQGRAGRVRSGRCWKLWPENERLEPWLAPESERADLADFVLSALVWGCRQASDLRLLSAPSPALWQQAVQVLITLGALDKPSGQLTATGRAMAVLGLHPRLARMIQCAITPEDRSLAWACAILLGERDILGAGAPLDFQLRLQALLKRPTGALNQQMLSRVREAWKRRIDTDHLVANPSCQAAGFLLAHAWPDRLGLLQNVAPDRRGQLCAHYQLSSGRQTTLNGPEAQQAPPCLVALEMEAGESSSTIRLFAAVYLPLSQEKPAQVVAKTFSGLVTDSLEISWEGFRPRARHCRRIDQLVLEEKPLPVSQIEIPTLIASLRDVLHPADGSRSAAESIARLPWSTTATQFIARVRWAHHLQVTQWPDSSDQVLANTLDRWLLPQIKTSQSPVLDETILLHALENLLDWNQHAQLNQKVPPFWQVPSGSRRPLEYPDPWTGQANAAPILAVRIQEVFGMAHQPCVLGVPVVLHLLSPAQRPLQITADLESFWQRTWPEIRKEMRGRYPRHYWPENPLEAEPSARAKPRGS